MFGNDGQNKKEVRYIFSLVKKNIELRVLFFKINVIEIKILSNYSFEFSR